MKKEKTLYLCDPHKNKECEKTNCQTKCKFTDNKKFAVKGNKLDRAIAEAIMNGDIETECKLQKIRFERKRAKIDICDKVKNFIFYIFLLSAAVFFFSYAVHLIK